MRSRLDTDSASGLGSSWLHASQQSSLLPWQISAAGLATFMHVCVGSMICFLSTEEVDPTLYPGLTFDEKKCTAIYLRPGDAL